MSESKADELVAKALKKLKSFSFFGNKYEDAAELLEKACNQYKLAKVWRKAGETYLKLAEVNVKLDSEHDSASNYVSAANAYKKVRTKRAVAAGSARRGDLRARVLRRSSPGAQGGLPGQRVARHACEGVSGAL